MSKALVSHVGVAVADLDKAMAQYTALVGHPADMIEVVAEQKVRVAIFAGPGGEEAGGRVELLMPTAEDSPIAKFLAKKGDGLHHICIYVDDIDAKLVELKQAGVRLIDEKPRLGAGGCRIAFVHPAGANGVLVELEERR
jgi:methylmalonyl-CoA/ethylmalonyl-CoA epimerase